MIFMLRLSSFFKCFAIQKVAVYNKFYWFQDESAEDIGDPLNCQKSNLAHNLVGFRVKDECLQYPESEEVTWRIYILLLQLKVTFICISLVVKILFLSFLIIVLETELCIIGALSHWMSFKKSFGKVKEKFNYS